MFELKNYHVAVIGGGFYGAVSAAYIAKANPGKRICLIEEKNELLTRSSQQNQARVHGGYHYPRSFITAIRSQRNSPRFLKTWPEAVLKVPDSYYAVARNSSKASSFYFSRVMSGVGAELQPADKHIIALFNDTTIENVFKVNEAVFDYEKLRDLVSTELAELGVEIFCDWSVRHVKPKKSGILLESTNAPGEQMELNTRVVLNCTYSRLRSISGIAKSSSQALLKHEIAEMVLVKTPTELESMAVTVMDGPFFSLLPFPSTSHHTLSHVRYTPHLSWIEDGERDPYEVLSGYHKESHFERMRRDAARYLPPAAKLEYISSMFEVKTVLMQSESDDGRPILFEKAETIPNYYSILGAKIDNVFDVFDELDKIRI